MSYITLIKNNLKSIISKKKILLVGILIFIYIFCSIELMKNFNLYNYNILIDILNGKLNYSIQGKFLYILNQFIIISIFGNYLYIFIKYNLQYHIIRIGNVFKWYMSLIITIIIVVIMYYIFLITLFLIYILIRETHTFFEIVSHIANMSSINSIFINILNSVLYVVFNIFLFLIVKNNILSYCILLIIQLLSIFITILSSNIAKLLPTAQSLIIPYLNNKGNYKYLLVSIFLLIFITNKYINKNLFDIINIKEN